MANSRVELYTEKSHGLMRSGQVVEEEAIKADRFEQEKTRDEMIADELMQMGLTRNEQSKYLEAQEYLQAAIIKLGDSDEAKHNKCLYGLANIARELGDTTRALELFRQAIAFEMSRYQPDYINLYELQRNIGITHLITEDYASAADSFLYAGNVAENILRDQNRLAPVKSYLGLALVLQGEQTAVQGLKILKEARELYPVAGREDSMDWASHRFHMARAREAYNNYFKVTESKYLKVYVEYTESVRLRTQITETRKQIGNRYHHSRLADPTEGLYRVALILGYKAEAEKHLKKAMAHYHELGNKQKKVAELEECLRELQSQIELENRSARPAGAFYQSVAIPDLSPQNKAVTGQRVELLRRQGPRK